MREKIGIMIIGLLLLLGTIAAVPVNAATSGSNPLTVDNVVDINSTEDTTYVVNLTEFFESGWYSMVVSDNENFSVNISGTTAGITPVRDWNGDDSFLLTASYYSVSPPPSNTIRSAGGETYVVQFNMHIAAVNDPPYVKADAPLYYRAYGNSTVLNDLHFVFGDVDNYYLTYAGYSPDPNILVNVDGSKMEIRSVGDYYGVSVLNLSVSDGEYTTTYQVKVYATPDYDIVLDEDSEMLIQVSDYLPDGWYSLDVCATDGINAYFNSTMNAVMVGTQTNWNGVGTVELTAHYYSVPQPPGNTIRSDLVLTVDVPVTVMPVNDPPVIKQSVENIVSFNEDTELTVNLYDYFGDVDNSVLQFTAVSSTPSVSVSIDSDGILTLTPAHDWNGQFTLDVSASDGNSAVDMQVVLQVTPTPDIRMNEDTTYVMNLCNYFNEGWVSMDPKTDSNISVSIDGNSAHFIPSSNWNGEDNITFTATYSAIQPDSSRLPPSYYTVSKVADVTVTPVNDAPFVKACFPSYVQMSEDGVISANLYDYFGDIDSPELQFTATSTSGHISFAINQSGEITIRPEANWSGYTNIIISAFDGELVTSAEATLAVSPSPDITMEEDTPSEINLADYFEPGGISASISGNGEHINATIDTNNGTLTLNPELNWNGYTTLEISVRYSNYVLYGVDPMSAPGYHTVSKRVDIVVEPVNDPPVQIAALPDLSTNEDTTITLDLNNYFTDVDSPLSFNITTGAGLDASFDQNTGILTITPLSNWNGNSDMNIMVSDGQYNISLEKAVMIRPVNDAPTQIAALPEFQMNEDETMTIDMNDYFSDVDSPLNFTAEPNGPFNVSVNDTGIATIVPAANWNGQTSFDLTVSDGEFSIAEPVNLDIKAVNDAPVEIASLPTLEFNEDGVAFIDLNNYFEDIDSTLTFSVTAGEGLSATVSSVNHVLRVTADSNWNGNSEIKVTATDGEFSLGTTENIHVLSVNDAPTVLKNPAVLKGMEDSVITLDLDDYFNDVDSSLTYTWTAPDSLSLSMDPESHVVTIIPKSNWYGNADITFTATDGSYSVTIHPQVTVKNVEDAPIALESGKVFKGTGGQVITVDLSTLFSDPDADSLTYTVTSADGTTIPFTVDQQRHTLSITVPEKAQGTFGLNVTASDGEKTASTDVYALVMPQSSGGVGGTEAGLSPAMSDGAVMALAIASSAALVGMLIYHTYQYRKYENKKKDAML